MNIESLLTEPLYYTDGSVQMRLRLEKPNIAVCLEWLCGKDWIEVSSMRPIAFNVVLEKFSHQKKEV